MSITCLGQTDPLIDSSIKKISEEMNLENIENPFEILSKLGTKKEPKVISNELVGSWIYEYSIKSSGQKYKSSNAIKRFQFDSNGHFLQLRKSLTDSIHGEWAIENGFLQLKFSEPYFKKGRPENINELSDYEASLLTLDNEIHYIHKIDDQGLYIVSSVVLPGDNKQRTVRFKYYKKAVANIN